VSLAWHRVGAGGRPEFLRDADGDQLCFVHAGTGTLRTEYGPLDYRPGDYLIIPRAPPTGSSRSPSPSCSSWRPYESRFGLPDKGLLGRHALFDPAMLEVPEAEAVEEEASSPSSVKRGGTTPASRTRSTLAT